jgi:hypothetical protein
MKGQIIHFDDSSQYLLINVTKCKHFVDENRLETRRSEDIDMSRQTLNKSSNSNFDP